MTLIKKTLKGPQNTQLILDQAQVFPDDPGAGTPATVKYRNHYGSYWCCVGDEECDGVELPQEVLDWLNSSKIVNEVEAIEA